MIVMVVYSTVKRINQMQMFLHEDLVLKVTLQCENGIKKHIYYKLFICSLIRHLVAAKYGAFDLLVVFTSKN